MLALALGASSPSATWRTVLVDDAFVVVDKGSGLLTVPGRGIEKADCLLSRMRAAGFDEIMHAPHRLDRDTSGVVPLSNPSPVSHPSS
jgi:tRNA pseudouridine32 synthase / 23S rRNA pseudouridine746 synthase